LQDKESTNKNIKLIEIKQLISGEVKRFRIQLKIEAKSIP
jgi:hypothetical protein